MSILMRKAFEGLFVKRFGIVIKILALAVLAIGAGVAASQEKILYSFGADSTDSADPWFSGLVFDGKGNLYGTTYYGGANDASTGGAGTVFELSPAAGAAWTEKVLYSFGATSTDGSGPLSGLIFDAKGNLYGTTYNGGVNSDKGTIFELSPAADGSWTEKVLNSFGADSTDGTHPSADLIFDAKGNLYGTTSGGGVNGDGTVFELTPATGGGWTETVLHGFGATGKDGKQPNAGLIFDAKGNLYGATDLGGAYGSLSSGGTVFELTPDASGDWTAKVLYSFGADSTSGPFLNGSLIFDATGNLYGTTEEGGANNGNGTVFELTPADEGSWTEKVLHSFGATGTDGAHPWAGLTFDAAGDLYGATKSGGDDGSGTVFELTPAGDGSWTEKVLESFGSTSTDGTSPASGLIFDAQGNLYGTTMSGGAHYTGSQQTGGTVFEVAFTTAAVPAFSPGGGTYAVAKTVRISDGTPGATIYYTTDGDTPSTSSDKYTEPIDVSETETIKAIAVVKGLPQSAVATATFVIEERAATPGLSPGAGTFDAAQKVTLTDATKSAVIRYTINGATPTANSARYTAPISVTKTTTIEAIAIADGYVDSEVASATYRIAPHAATPEFSPTGRTYSKIQSVRISDATTGSTIYYTRNGTTPTASSAKYTGPITVSSTETIEAIAVAAGHSWSAVATAAYTINLPHAAKPVISPSGGTYSSARNIVISDLTPGATIFYTTDGTTPTTKSKKYTAKIPVSHTTTLKAIAVATGYSESAEASETYTFQ
jgi:uncharacterized repeat protein (TIGR03803 family)